MLHFILEKLLKLFLLIRIRVKIHHFCADKAEYFSYSDQNVPRIQNKLVVTFPKEIIKDQSKTSSKKIELKHDMLYI